MCDPFVMAYLLSELEAANSSESVTPTLAFWATWVQILGVAAAVMLAGWAIWIARGQLTDARRSAFGQFILGIDDAFRNYENVRRYINRPVTYSKSKPDLSDVYRYIAVFERLGIFIEWRLMKIEKLDELYGDRFEKLISYGAERFKADFKTGFPPQARPAKWDGFIFLWQALEGRRKVGKPPETPRLKKNEDDDPEMPPATA
jgi:hypothetical protein